MKSAAFLVILSLSGWCRGDVVINEIHYDPDETPDHVEFIELQNTGTSSANLSGWTFSEGLSAAIPAGTNLAPDEFLILAEDPGQLTSFYPSIPGSVNILSYGGRLSGDGEEVTLIDSTGMEIDRVRYRPEFPWPVSAGGTGASMQLIHPSLDNDLGGAWRGATPTPGQTNSVFSTTAPPLIRQVTHTPEIPKPSEATTITCKVTDNSGVATVDLLYQVVQPGSYIPAYLPLPYGTLTGSPSTPLSPNPAFENPANWSTLSMVDDGTSGDAVAADSIFTVVVPVQNNRALVRYRIVAEDAGGKSIRVPYTDDASLNFAYYVYDGIPSWTATSSVHAEGSPHTYTAEDLGNLEVYTMITRNSDRSDAFAYSTTGDSGLQIPKGNGGRNVYNWECAFVYDGIVYDHVGYRLRQNNDRYFGVGKRSMRYRFNRGHYFQARDDEGKKIDRKWKRMNSWKMNPFGGLNRFGLDQVTNYKLWRMVGVECPRFQPIHFRMVDQSAEDPTQQGGDFFGLACFHQNIDGRLIDDLGIPKGNVYKLKDGSTNASELQRYQGRDAVTNGSDFSTIRNSLNPSRSDSWLRSHVDWEQWYRYHAVLEGVRHYDLGATNTHFKNRGWHFMPAAGASLGLLRVIPHDHNGSWYKGYHDNQNSSGTSIGTDYPWWAIFGDRDRPPSGPEKTAFTIEYRNFIREFRQLLWQEETVNTLIDDYVEQIREFSYADRDRWTGGTAEDGTEQTTDVDILAASMKEFAFVSDTYLGSNLVGGRGRFFDDLSTDSAIPNQPTINYAGSAGHPVGGLAFESSAYSDPQGSPTFSKMEWRIAEVGKFSSSASVPLISSGGTWSYLDQSSAPDPEWNELTFNDDGWLAGDAQFGWGEGDEVTQVFGRNIATYFRRDFNVSDPAAFEALSLGVIRDDGVVIYLNGEEVLRNHMPDGTITHTTIASQGASGSQERDFQPFTISTEHLVAGNNVLAIAIHQGVVNSGDMSFDLFMNGVRPEPIGPVDPPERKFEWNASWESGELTSFNSTIAPPASATSVGKTYRARVRHGDSSGRWSEWSEAIEFIAGAADVDSFRSALVVSEIMYHSAPPSPAEIAAGFVDDDQFDFIEIRNISDAVVDLNDIRLTKGVDFDFSLGTITQLAPGEVVIVVDDLAAFEMRHGPGLPVAGEWEGRLQNGSELVKLSFGAGESVVEFTFDDAAPWPTSADGSGSSLVLIDPFSNPGQGDVTNWRAASATPGLAGTAVFSGTTDEELNHYAFGNKTAVLNRQPDGRVEVTVTLNIYAEDLAGHLESGHTLSEWKDASEDYQKVALEDLGNGYGRVTLRSMDPVPNERYFIRYAVLLR